MSPSRLLLLGAALVAGCAIGPDYQRPAVDLPATYAARSHSPQTLAVPPTDASSPALARLSDTDALLASAAPTVLGPDTLLDAAWWTSLSDPQLDALIATALERNQDLRIAALRIAQFDAYLQVSRSAGMPQISGQGSRTRDTLSENRQQPLAIGTDPVDNAYTASVAASWELDLWGRLARADEAALSRLAAREEERRSLMQSLVSELVTGYVRLLTLDRELELLQQSLHNLRESVRLAEARFVGGGSGELPVVQAVAALQARLPALPALHAEIATLENRLNELAGRGPGPVLRGSRLEDLAAPAVPAGLPAELLARRPDVRAAEKELVAANASIGIAKADYLPRISLTASSGFASNELSELTMLTSNFGSFGVNLLGPIFTAGRVAGQVREAEAVQQQAAAVYVRTVQTALREVEDALTQHATAGQRVALHALHLQTLRQLQAMAQSRVEGGTAAYFDVLAAELQLSEGLLMQAQARGEQFTAVIAIYKAMGGGWNLPELTATQSTDTDDRQ